MDQDARREQRRQSLLIDRIADQFEDRLAEDIASAMREMVRVWRITGEVVNPRDFRSKLEAVYSQMIRSTIVSFGMRVFNQAKDAGVDLERKEDFATTMTNEALRYIDQESIRQRITSVEETTRQSIIRAIAKSYAEGLGETATAQAIEEVIGVVSRSRARTIARTEAHGAANYGANVAAKKTDLPMKREWISGQDKRTRTTENGDLFDHVGANGQIVGPEEPFQIAKLDGGTEALMYPGDPNGSAGNVINCRCSLGFIVDRQAIIDRAVADARGQQTNAPVEPTPPAALKPVKVPAKPVALVIPNKIPELEKFIIANGLAVDPQLKGMSATGIAQLTKAALEVKQRFGLDPLQGVGPSVRFGLGKAPNANAAIFRRVEKSTKKLVAFLHTPTNFGSLKVYTEQHLDSVKQSSYFYSNAAKKISGKTDQYVQDNFSKINGSYSWTYSGMKPPEQAAEFIVYHEYGHVLHLVNDAIGKDINDFIAKFQPIANNWDVLISKYADTNNKEYVAEAFSIYMDKDKSQRFRVHPELIKIFQKWDKMP